MPRWLPLIPEQGSELSKSVDRLFLFETGVTLFFLALIAVLIFAFAVKYRRRSDQDKSPPIFGDLRLEVAWSAIPLVITMVMFAWGAKIYIDSRRIPEDSMTITVVGKQWMWKFQHPTGQAEIDTLHLPVGRPIKLFMTSEDVIHSLFIPAFRLKQDVLPGRYTTMGFVPTKVGRFRLFCAEYCGTQHSGMIGWVNVLEPADYETWLRSRVLMSGSPVDRGQVLFQRLACGTCHAADAPARGPRLEGLFGRKVQLANGRSVVADEGYFRESLLEPQAKIVKGYSELMPTYRGQLTEESILDLIAYLKSLPATQEVRQ